MMIATNPLEATEAKSQTHQKQTKATNSQPPKATGSQKPPGKPKGTKSQHKPPK